tara:strand:- start:9206 stop:10192 length:987 start_codon:yes stop_codon:yes gene_type:complete
MGEVSIFQGANLPANVVGKGVSDLGKSIAGSGSNIRRIKTSTNGTFTKIVNGQKAGKAVRGGFNAIIVDLLPSVSRSYYASTYDPDAKATLPDCWSNLGVRPEEGADNIQAKSCATCPQNVTGSGTKGKGRACRYQRRVALMLEGDASGDTYQFNIPAKSLFGDGNGHEHPFESYCKFLLGNEFSPDRVVTRIEYDDEEETMVLKFSPVRPITHDELDMVEAAQADPSTRELIQLIVAAADGVKDGPKTAEKKEEVFKEETKAKPVANKFDPFGEEAEEEEAEEEAPTKRKPKAKAKAKATSAAESPEMADALSGWLDDDDNDDEVAY